MVGTVPGRGDHRSRSYPGAEGEETGKVCETAVPAEQYHHVRYRCIHARREADMRGRVKPGNLAGVSMKLPSITLANFGKPIDMGGKHCG